MSSKPFDQDNPEPGMKFRAAARTNAIYTVMAVTQQFVIYSNDRDDEFPVQRNSHWWAGTRAANTYTAAPKRSDHYCLDIWRSNGERLGYLRLEFPFADTTPGMKFRAAVLDAVDDLNRDYPEPC